MKPTVYVLFLFVSFLYGCTDHQSTIAVAEEFLTDTLLERNDPAALDLSKHQLFIDTTRSNDLYQTVEDWEFSTSTQERVEASLAYLMEHHQPVSLGQYTLPDKFVTIREADGEYLLYDRCDGMEARFEIRDTALIFYGTHEPVVALYTGEVRADETKLRVEIIVADPESEVGTSKGRLTVLNMSDENIHRISIQTEPVVLVNKVISKDLVTEYDVMVNHCPENKVMEYRGFEVEY